MPETFRGASLKKSILGDRQLYFSWPQKRVLQSRASPKIFPKNHKTVNPFAVGHFFTPVRAKFGHFYKI